MITIIEKSSELFDNADDLVFQNNTQRMMVVCSPDNTAQIICMVLESQKQARESVRGYLKWTEP